MKAYWDDSGTWTEITGIIEFPEVQTRLDLPSSYVLTLGDFEGSLYSTWEPRDFIEIKIEDDSSNVIFRGYLVDKKFRKSELILILNGFSSKLDWTPFHKNYILAEGKVASIPYDQDIAGLTANINPDGDVATNWAYSTGANHYTEIDEGTTENTDDYIRADSTDDGQTEVFDMETISDVTTVTKIVVHFYGKNVGVVEKPTCTLSFGGQGAKDINFAIGVNSWVEVEFDGLGGSQADLTNLQITITAASNILATQYHYVYTMYATVTYTGKDPEAIGLTDDEDEAFTWSNDEWINNRDVGILIVDNTQNLDTETWECTNIDVWNESAAATGDEDSLDYAVVDGDVYYAYQTVAAQASWDMNIGDGTETGGMTIAPGATHGGSAIGTDQTLHKITINYRVGIYSFHSAGSAYLEIKKDTVWFPIVHIRGGTIGDYTWHSGNYVIEDTNAELAKFLVVDGANYDELKGVRIRCVGTNPSGVESRTLYVKVDLLTVDIEYEAYDLPPVMYQITDNGASYIVSSGVTWSETGTAEGDYFKFGENTRQILADVATRADVAIYCQSTLSKYIARWYKGVSCMEVIEGICLLEGLHWFEDFENNEIVLSKEDDFADSGVDLTSADYDFDWEFEDKCNAYFRIEVFGNASMNIYAKAEDLTVDTLLEKVIIDETITTRADAKYVADTQLAELKVKRPSIKLTLNGTRPALSVGKTVTITLERPTVAQADYPIRMMERGKRGIDGIKTVIYAGLGETKADEKLARTIRRIAHIAHKAHCDRLISTPWSAGASIQWSDIAGADAGARAAAVSDAVYGAAWNGVGNIAPSKNVVYDKIETLDYDAFLGIGEANEQDVNCPFVGVQNNTYACVSGRVINTGADDMWLTYDFPLPLQKGGYHLVLTKIEIALQECDDNDYITRVFIYAYTDEDTADEIEDDATDRKVEGVYTYNFDDYVCNGTQDRIEILVRWNCTDAGASEGSWVKAFYYYEADA